MNNKLITLLVFILPIIAVNAQNNIGIGTTTPNTSAMLDVSSVTKGLLIPRMTALQRLAINPAASARALMVFDIDSSAFMFWTGTVWNKLGAASGSGASQWLSNGNNIYNINSGYTGIGNSNPQFSLDLSGRMRFRGGSDNNSSAGLWLSGTGTDSAVNKVFIGMRADSSAGFYSDKFNVGWGLIFDGRNGNVGIGNQDPSYPLSFKDVSGDKISLFKDGNGNYYGLGIGNATMQLITPHNNADILFGYGRSNSYTENMRVKGNGAVGIGETNPSLGGLVVNKKVGATNAVFGSNTTGVAIESSFPGIGFNNYFDGSRKTIAAGYSGYIGVNPSSGGMQFSVSGTSVNAGITPTLNTGIAITASGNTGIGITDPAHKLDVGARMRIRSAPGLTAGLWLNNDANNASPAFIGMLSDNQVGFYGGGTGWSFLMNTQTGAVSFGGNAGQPGQVLTSNGTNGAPTWQGAGGGKPFVVRPSGNSPDLGTSGRVDVPGMVANFTLDAPAQVVFQYKLSIANRGCFACGDRRTFIILIRNIVGGTTDIATTTVYSPNQEIADGVSGPIALDLPAGTYSYKLALAPSIYGAATVYARQQEGIFTWQIYPN